MLGPNLKATRLHLAQRQRSSRRKGHLQDQRCELGAGLWIPNCWIDLFVMLLQVASLLQLEGGASALPDVWEVVYKTALAFAKAAAVDEMLGNVPASLRSYSKVLPGLWPYHRHPKHEKQ